MNPGDIILIEFPFTIPTQSKIRPAVVVTVAQDKYTDVIIKPGHCPPNLWNEVMAKFRALA